MRCLNVFVAIGAVALLFATGVARAAEPQPSAAYDSWAKLNPGSSITIKTLADSGGRQVEMQMVYTLSAVTPEKVTLDVKHSMVMGGRSMDIPGSRPIEVLKSGATKGGPAHAPTSPKPDSDIRESDETLKIGDKEYKCHVIEGTTNTEHGKATSKVWTCPEVPNLIARMESSLTASGKMSMEVIKIELK